MPSIRRSLVAYFLLLLGSALAALGLLIDRFADQTLHAREEAEVERIHQEFEYRCKESAAKFDEELLAQAQSLSGEFRRTYLLLTSRAFEDYARNQAMATILTNTLPQPILPGFTAFALNVNQSVRTTSFSVVATTNRMDEIRNSFDSAGNADFYQFHIPRWKQIVRSPRQPVQLPNDVEGHGLSDTKEHDIDTYRSSDQTAWRRVIVRTNLLANPRTTFFAGPPPGSRPGQGGGSRPPGGGERRPETPGRTRPESSAWSANVPLDVLFPPVYLQLVRNTEDLKAQLDVHTLQREQQLGAVQLATQQSLANLRSRVKAIAMLTFLALGIGGWLLVGRSLAPVHKLSDAAGRVSEKDFRLPVEKNELSTELVPIHDRLTHSLAALQVAFEREKQAVADISHELRTPVAALLATIDVSVRKPRTAEQYHQTLLECRSITKQLGELVERVMTLAYLDAGQAEVASREADVSELAEGCATVIRPLAEAHGVTLTSELERTAQLQTDPDKLREVMMNLLHNAVEYNRPGGSIAIKVKREPNGGAILEVSDTGIGMNQDVRARIFERFYRADASRTSAGAHAGLGLAIVKEYVNRMGGTIAVESEPDRGSTFRVTLPARM